MTRFSVLLLVLSFVGHSGAQTIGGAPGTNNPKPSRLKSIADFVDSENPNASASAKALIVSNKTAKALGAINNAKTELGNQATAWINLGNPFEPYLSSSPFQPIIDKLKKAEAALCGATYWVDVGDDNIRDGVAFPGPKNNIGLPRDVWCDPNPISFVYVPIIVHEGGHIVTFPGWGSAASSKFDNKTLVGPIACEAVKLTDELASLWLEKSILTFLDEKPVTAFSDKEFCKGLEELFSGVDSYIGSAQANAAKAKAAAAVTGAGAPSASDKKKLEKAEKDSKKSKDALKKLLKKVEECNVGRNCW